jgi:hypothetical protein
MVSILKILPPLLVLLVPSIALAQTCSGQFPAGTVCGNVGGTQSAPSPAAVTLDIAGVAALRLRPVVNTQIVHLKYISVVGDIGAGFFVGSTGQAPGTYVDNGRTIIVPTAGDGSAAWLRMGEAKNWTIVPLPNTRWIASSATIDLNIFSLPAKTKLTGIYLDVVQGFAGVTGCCTMQVGTTSGGNDLILSSSVSAVATWGLTNTELVGGKMDRANLVQGGFMSWAGTNIFVRLAATANIGNTTATLLTAGNANIYFQTERLGQ